MIISHYIITLALETELIWFVGKCCHEKVSLTKKQAWQHDLNVQSYS